MSKLLVDLISYFLDLNQSVLIQLMGPVCFMGSFSNFEIGITLIS